eukprot:4376296-Pyramimonas_sp.AAC.1
MTLCEAWPPIKINTLLVTLVRTTSGHRVLPVLRDDAEKPHLRDLDAAQAPSRQRYQRSSAARRGFARRARRR